MITLSIDKDLAIYRAWLEAKTSKEMTVEEVCEVFGISRTALHDAIKRVKRGNQSRIRQELIQARNEILWTWQFEPMYKMFPDLRIGATNPEMGEMINKMHLAGFPKTLIAKKMQIARSTVEYHLKKSNLN